MKPPTFYLPNVRKQMPCDDLKFLLGLRKKRLRRLVSHHDPLRTLLFLALLVTIVFYSLPIKAQILAEIQKPGIVITEKDLERYISYYGPEAAQVLASPAKREEFLKDLVKMFSVAAKAKEEGFDQQPEIKAQLEFIKDKFLAKKYLHFKLQEVLKEVHFTEEDLRLYYRTHPEEFKLPARVRFSTLMLKGANLETLLAEAKRLRKQISQGNLTLSTNLDFLFVRDSGWKILDRLEAPLKETLKQLPLGVWSEAFSLGERVYLVRKIDFEEAKQRPFAEVKEKIREKLLAETKRQKLQAIIKKILIEQGASLNPKHYGNAK